MKSTNSRINQAINDLKVNGFAIVNNYLSNTIELENFKHKFYKLVCIKAKQYKIKTPTRSNSSINQVIMELDSVNKKIGAFLNDSLNATPELFQLLTSEKITSLAKTVIGNKEGSILTNNFRSRIQIPGHDNVANLPWHQDSSYNNFYKYNNSIVIWASISDIDEQAGPIVFKKGSHFLRQIPKKEYLKPNKKKVFTISKNYIDDSEFIETSFPTKSGDVVLIDMNTIHRSGENKSADNIKLSIQCRCHDASKPGFLPHYD